eukprot:m.167308 g.167308  ORF g.167308 m.167308 type:complete len:1079 (-) comp12809_c0_seq1:153-3389(-)
MRGPGPVSSWLTRLTLVAACLSASAYDAYNISNASAVFTSCPTQTNSTACNAAPGCTWSGSCVPMGWFTGRENTSTVYNETLSALNSYVRYSLFSTVFPYPGSTPTGTYYYGWVAVKAMPNESYITVYYNLTGVPPSATGGLHIHTGTSCATATAVGGHYWTPTSAPDPWSTDTVWTSNASGIASGSFNVSTGYQYMANLGHAVVVHLPDGTRLGCGVLTSYVDQVVEADALAGNWMSWCSYIDPYYELMWLNMSTVNPSNSSYGTYSFRRLFFTDADCTVPAPDTYRPNETISGLFSIERPAQNRGPGAVDIAFFTGYDFSTPYDFDVVTLQYPFLYFGWIHQNTSSPWNLNYLQRPMQWAAPLFPASLADDILAHPVTTQDSILGLWGGDCVYNMPYNYTDPNPSGYEKSYYQFAQVQDGGITRLKWQAQIHFWFTSSTCTGTPDYIANFPWSDLELTGPNNYIHNAVNTTFHYPATPGFQNGLYYSMLARAGSRLALGAVSLNGSIPSGPESRPVSLGPFMTRIAAVPTFSGLIGGNNGAAFNNNSMRISETMVAEMTRYPDSVVYAGTTYFGTVTVVAVPSATSLTVTYDLTGLPAGVSGGIHIHSGTSCLDASLVGGHYWTPLTSADPWNAVQWTSDGMGNAAGSVVVSTGYQYAGNLGHAVVLHLPNGTRLACGVLQSLGLEAIEMGQFVGMWGDATLCSHFPGSPLSWQFQLNITAVNLTYGLFVRNMSFYNDAACTQFNGTSLTNGTIYTEGPAAGRGWNAVAVDFIVDRTIATGLWNRSTGLAHNRFYDSATIQFPYLLFGAVQHAGTTYVNYTGAYRPTSWGPPFLSSIFPSAYMPTAATIAPSLHGVWQGMCAISCPCNDTTRTTSGFWVPAVEFNTVNGPLQWRAYHRFYTDSSCSGPPVSTFNVPWAPMTITGIGNIPYAFNVTLSSPGGTISDIVLATTSSLALGARSFDNNGAMLNPSVRPTELGQFMLKNTTFPTLETQSSSSSTMSATTTIVIVAVVAVCLLGVVLAVLFKGRTGRGGSTDSMDNPLAPAPRSTAIISNPEYEDTFAAYEDEGEVEDDSVA